MKRFINRRSVVVAAALALAGVIAYAAHAGLQAGSGGPQLNVAVRSDTEFFSTTSNDFRPLPGASIPVVVPEGTSRLVLARFSASAACSSEVSAGCFIRIVALDSSGTRRVLHPATPTSVFTSSIAPSFRAHTIDRWRRLGPGTWTIEVRLRTGTSFHEVRFTVDDWLFRVDIAT